MLVVSKTGLATDAVYLFRYRIKNKYGWSEDFSPILSARTATYPSIVPSLSFAIIDQLKVRIGWNQPYNGGSPVISYTVEFKNNQGKFVSIGSSCDGSDQAVVLLRYCDVSFQGLRGNPLNLLQNNLVVVRVLATNKIGSGAFSDFNTEGILIQTEPVTPPNAPTIVEYTEYTVKLTFEILTLD